MRIFNIFKGKKIDEDPEETKDAENPKKKKTTVQLESSSFSEAHISKNSYQASKEATIGREILNEVLQKRENIDIEFSKGWFFEAKGTTTFNINSAEKGSSARAVMADSEVSCKYNNTNSNSGTPHDIEIFENGIATGVKIQSKAANNYKNAAKYQNDEKYDGMIKHVVKGQSESIKNDVNLKITDETRSTVTDEFSYTDEKGNIIKSDAVELMLIKDKKALEKDAYKTEIKESFKASIKTGFAASQTAFLLDFIDDLVEYHELDLKKNLGTGAKSGVKATCYTMGKDVAVNKLKIISNETFASVMVALNVGEDLKKIYMLSEDGAHKETIREEFEALVYKAGIGYASNLMLVFPGGAGASVAINYIGNKLIQKYFYSEISIHLRTLRRDTIEHEDNLKRLQIKERDTNNAIQDFLALVSKTCEDRIEIISKLNVDCSQRTINNVSLGLVGKKIKMTTDSDLENLFDNELII